MGPLWDQEKRKTVTKYTHWLADYYKAKRALEVLVQSITLTVIP